MEEFKKILELAWNDYTDDENLDMLRRKCEVSNVTLIQHLEFTKINEKFENVVDGNLAAIQQIQSKLKSIADGTSNVPPADKTLVSLNIAKEIVNMILNYEPAVSPLDESILLSSHQRLSMEALTRTLGALSASVSEGSLFYDFVEYLGKNTLPLEMLWWLHSCGFVLFTTYISSNLSHPDKLSELNGQLLSLVCGACETDESDASVRQPPTEGGGARENGRDGDDRVKRAMVRDLLSSLIAASQRETMKGREACAMLVELVTRKALDQLLAPPHADGGNGAPPCNYIRLLRADHSPTPLAAVGLRSLGAGVLRKLLSCGPLVSLAATVTRQTEWAHARTPAHVVAFVQEVIECLGVAATLQLLLKVLKDTEVNWKHLMIVVSTMIVCIEDSKKYLRAFVDELIADSLSTLNNELLIAGLLLARQCCHEGGRAALIGQSGFPRYDEWFIGAFGAILPPASLQFLMRLLTELMPFEPAYCLQTHIRKAPVAPSGYQHVVLDYVALARCRLGELNPDTSPSILGTESTRQDVELVVSHYNAHNEILPALVIASRFNRQRYEQDFLPQLLSGSHRKLVDMLAAAGSIPAPLLKKYSAEPPKSSVSNSEDSKEQLRVAWERFTKVVGTGVGAGNDLSAACKTAIENMKLTSHDLMIEALRFGLEYLKASGSCPELTVPNDLSPRLSYVADRLSHCGHSHSDILSSVPARLLDGPQLSLSAWLDLELSIDPEFLPSRRAYFAQTLSARYVASRATCESLVECACRAGGEMRQDIVATVTSMLHDMDDGGGGGGGGTNGLPWLLDKWVDAGGVVASHEEFFSVVQLLPPWLLLGDARGSTPSRDTVSALADLINIPLLDSISEKGFLSPALVWHLVTAFTQLRPRGGAATALSLLVQRCPPFHLALLVNSASVYPLLIRAFPMNTLSDISVKLLARIMRLCHEFLTNKSQAVNLTNCLKIGQPWEVGILAWKNTTEPAYKRSFVDETDLKSKSDVLRWVFFFGVLDLGRRLDAKEAEFTIANRRISFTYSNVAEPNPLDRLSAMSAADPAVLSALTADATRLPLTCLALRSVHLASLAGLLFVLRDSRACCPATRRAVADLAARVSGRQFVLPAFADWDAEAFVRDVNYLAVLKMGGEVAMEVDEDVDMFGDDFEVPDDCP